MAERNHLGILFTIGLLLILLPQAAAARECPEPQKLAHESATIVSKTDSINFRVEIADTAPARAAGLMCRKSLADCAGMLFVYPEAQVVKMWMKNTYIPLDILFVDADGRIVKIVEKIAAEQPGKISSGEPVTMVLELPAGSAARHGIRLGDRVQRD